jgi:hypothetical protein
MKTKGLYVEPKTGAVWIVSPSAAPKLLNVGDEYELGQHERVQMEPDSKCKLKTGTDDNGGLTAAQLRLPAGAAKAKITRVHLPPCRSVRKLKTHFYFLAAPRGHRKFRQARVLRDKYVPPQPGA